MGMMKITPGELLQLIKSHPKFHSTTLKEMNFSDWVENLPNLKDEVIFIKEKVKLLNHGCPSTFNLSFAEDFSVRILENIPEGKIDKFYDYTKLPYYGFSAVAPIIRMRDLEKIIEGSKNHLLLFHMLSIGGCVITKNNSSYEFFIKNLFDFFERLGLDIRNIVMTIHPGNETITKHGVTFRIPLNKALKFCEDLAKEKGFELKLTNEDTFLSLKLFGNPTPWGFRNEILYKQDSGFIDIATIEYLYFIPEFYIKQKGPVYKDIFEWDRMWVLDVIGFERVLSLVNGLKSVYKLPAFLEIEKVIFQKSQLKNELGSRLMGQLILTISAIFEETGSFSKTHLGHNKSSRKHRKTHLRELLYYLFTVKDILGIEIDVGLLKNICSAYNNYFPFGDLKMDDEMINKLTSILNKEYHSYQKFITQRDIYKKSENIEKLRKIKKIREKIKSVIY
jgi:hypothetical protein